MSNKEQHGNKEARKAPLMSKKEKRQAKHQKVTQNKSGNPPLLPPGATQPKGAANANKS